MSQVETILSALRRGPLTKADIYYLGAGMSANSRIAELRARGFDIRCERELINGRAVYRYRLVGQLDLSLETRV